MGIICLYVLIQKSGQKTAKSHLCAVACLLSSEAPVGKKTKFQCGTDKSADLEGRPPKQHVLGSGRSEKESIQTISTHGASTNLT